MAANTAPIFTLTPVVASNKVATLTSDSPLRAGTGNSFVTVKTAGANGTRIDRITAQVTGTSVALQVLLFVFDGTTNWFFKELAIAAVTPTTTLASSNIELSRTDGLPVLIMPSGYSLKAAITVSLTANATGNTGTNNAVVVTAYGGDF